MRTRSSHWQRWPKKKYTHGPISKTRDSRTAEKGTGVDPKSLFEEHEIVRVNNQNNKKSLYLSPGHVTGIVGLKKEESKNFSH